MGSTVLNILIEIYLEETHIFSDNNKQRSKIVYYLIIGQYLMFVRLNIMKNYLNSTKPILKFSPENEINNYISFLD